MGYANSWEAGATRFRLGKSLMIAGADSDRIPVSRHSRKARLDILNCPPLNGFAVPDFGKAKELCHIRAAGVSGTRVPNVPALHAECRGIAFLDPLPRLLIFIAFFAKKKRQCRFSRLLDLLCERPRYRIETGQTCPIRIRGPGQRPEQT